MRAVDEVAEAFDVTLRQHIYRQTIRAGKTPTVAQMAAALSVPPPKVKAGLKRLAQNHAFVLQENGELLAGSSLFRRAHRLDLLQAPV